ncbi:hypothetical protein ACHAQA_007715 [Verticillium albo-atrum]
MAANEIHEGSLVKIPREVLEIIIGSLSLNDTLSLAQTTRRIAPIAIRSLFINDRNSGEQHALNYGCDYGMRSLVRKAVKYGYDVNLGSDFSLPLVRTVMNVVEGSPKAVVKYLLRNGASIASIEEALVVFLCPSEDDSFDRGCHLTIPRMFLNTGLDVYNLEQEGGSVRLIADAIQGAGQTSCRKHGSRCIVRLVKLLLKRGASPDKGGGSPEDFSPLSCAMYAQKHPVQLVKLLLESGADPNARATLPCNGRRPHGSADHTETELPVRWAIFFLPMELGWGAKMQILGELLAHGADDNIPVLSVLLHEVIDGTASAGSEVLVPFKVACSILKLLLKSGADPTHVHQDKTPLQRLDKALNFKNEDRLRLAGILAKGLRRR